MEMHKIPIHLEVQDKFVWDLTFRQALILFIGAGLAYLMATTDWSTPLNDDLRPAALFLISDYVWTQVRRERHPRPRLLSIDEAWTLLQFDAGGRALATLTRRARKYNLGVRITTQLVNDFLASDSGQAILANANKLVLKTDAANIDTVAATLKLTESEKRFLLGAKKGEGLYFLGQAHVPLRVVASELEYDLANTNAQELRQQARKQEITIL
jgi:type IV secretory pathway VirB4 component